MLDTSRFALKMNDGKLVGNLVLNEISAVAVLDPVSKKFTVHKALKSGHSEKTMAAGTVTVLTAEMKAKHNSPDLIGTIVTTRGSKFRISLWFRPEDCKYSGVCSTVSLVKQRQAAAMSPAALFGAPA